MLFAEISEMFHAQEDYRNDMAINKLDTKGIQKNYKPI